MTTDLLIQASIEAKELNIHTNHVAFLMGHTSVEGHDHVMEIVEKQINEGEKLIEPIGGYVIKTVSSVDVSNGTITIDSVTLHVGKIVANQLKKADFVACFINTIGKKLELKAKQLMETGDLLEGYTLDLFGSEAAEATANHIHQSLENYARNDGLKVSNRYSPGYCNWDVAEQFKLFSLIPGDHFQIQLTESALMNPVKSVSGIIGIGKEVKYSIYTCSKCNDQKCIYRNKKSNQQNS